MANNAIQWEASVSEGNVLSTELNSLAAAARTNAGTEFDNTPGSGNNASRGRLRLAVDFASAPAAGGYVAVYRVDALDGTNYPDGSSSVDPGAHAWVCNIPVRADTAAQVLDSPEIPLGPWKQKFILENKTSQPFPASGSTLALWTYREEVE